MTDVNAAHEKQKQLADLVERLRDKAFKRCGPTMEAVHTKTDEWLAADAIEELMAALQFYSCQCDLVDTKSQRCGGAHDEQFCGYVARAAVEGSDG